MRAPLLRQRRGLGVTALIGAVFLVAGCAANDNLSEQYREGNDKGFISGDFRVVEIPERERGDSVTFAGVSERGEAISSDDYQDRVYVVNFWYAACGPCIAEAPLLEEVWQEYQADDVGFLGINIYDQPGTAVSFAEDNGISYPSVIDVNEGSVKLAFAAATPIQATPTTLVMDRDGRVAARIIGQLPSASILSTLVGDALGEEP
ncbi:alkyl hydroperoxide reductase [Microbacterium sp. Gd 4-13]|uniref:TlpA family protein disulfide reductase n=1 Tax=Microbacterium sp. Gd 4-13 TaxID=2173179 RepID=UPI000D56EACF|nr:TlpA disulfide reductase family protein [Microbacterium sp. Gd 4-13]PVW02021.1 alkyl hydroperoxide reductase [Microbacterium sp. Gd 4-13]